LVRLVPVKTQLALRRGGFLKSQAVLTVDIHLLLWWASMPEQLPESARSRLEQADQPLFFRVASLWEGAIKASHGREVSRWTPQPCAWRWWGRAFGRCQAEHVLAVRHLPWIHRNPFDHLLVVQAQGGVLPLFLIGPTGDPNSTAPQTIRSWKLCGERPLRHSPVAAAL
jgi:PIN domain nuclease of toxin-antitoxin system